MDTTLGRTGAAVPPRTARRLLLDCGLAAGPLFLLASLAQGLARPGFDLARQPISLLALGDLGWLQTANFEVSGLLFVAAAAGMRWALLGGRGDTWGPALIAGFGLGLIVAGACPADPAMGYPPGAPPGQPPVMSWHGAFHAAGFFLSMASFLGAGGVFARRYAAQGAWGWTAACVAAMAAVPAGVGASATSPGAPGLPLLGMLVVIVTWLTAVTARVRAGAA